MGQDKRSPHSLRKTPETLPLQDFPAASVPSADSGNLLTPALSSAPCLPDDDAQGTVLRLLSPPPPPHDLTSF